MLVLGIGWQQITYFLDHIHTSFLSLPAHHTKINEHTMAHAKKSTYAALILLFFDLQIAAEGRRNLIAPQARSAAFSIRCSDSNAIIWSVGWFGAKSEAMCIASIIPDIAFAAKAARAGKNRPSDTHLLKISDLQNSIRRGVPSPIPAGPGPAPGAGSI